jgi:hypothetical protein
MTQSVTSLISKNLTQIGSTMLYENTRASIYLGFPVNLAEMNDAMTKACFTRQEFDSAMKSVCAINEMLATLHVKFFDDRTSNAVNKAASLLRDGYNKVHTTRLATSGPIPLTPAVGADVDIWNPRDGSITPAKFDPIRHTRERVEIGSFDSVNKRHVCVPYDPSKPGSFSNCREIYTARLNDVQSSFADAPALRNSTGHASGWLNMNSAFTVAGYAQSHRPGFTPVQHRPALSATASSNNTQSHWPYQQPPKSPSLAGAAATPSIAVEPDETSRKRQRTETRLVPTKLLPYNMPMFPRIVVWDEKTKSITEELYDEKRHTSKIDVLNVWASAKENGNYTNWVPYESTRHTRPDQKERVISAYIATPQNL